jgi:type IV pilus assembly protein PilM
MEAAGIKEREVTSAVAGQAVIVRYIEMPQMSSEELAGAIKYEAEQYIPFELENVEVDYQILEEKMPQHPDKMRVLLVAAKKELIKEHLSLLEAASLKPLSIDVDAFALINAFERIKSPAKEECLALINIGHSLTNINILKGGVAYFTRDVFLAGKDISDGLAKKFGMEFNQAEKLKRERGKATGDDSFNKSLSSALGDLVGEIRLSFDYYENQALEKNIGHVFLTGGSSLLPELDHFLSETLGLKVSTWNPFEGLKIGEGVKEWERVSPAMAVSLGLALHEE